MCSSGFTPLSLTALKFRRAEDESRNHAQVRFSAGIVELGVQHLRIVQLLLQRLCGRSRCFATEKNLHRAIERRFRIGGRIHAEQRGDIARSEEHTSELQSLTNLVCRLLLEKK